MLNKLKNFSKSKLGAVLVFIVALPFVFFGMGSIFQNKDTNNIAKIDNFNISTKDFKFPNIFQFATKYIYLFVIILFLIYRFDFTDQYINKA